MSELAKAVKDHSLQAQVRRSMLHLGDFRIRTDLPKLLRDKLIELDRAAASQASRSA